ncbi:MAG: ATP-binding cassette domain-containing protein [Clostridium sp.]
MENIIEIKDLSKKYLNNHVLKNININIKRNEIYGLIGKNGAGKTTLMKIILGLENATKGNFKIIPNENNKSNIEIGAIVDSPAFYPYLSAKNNIEYYRILKGIKDKEITSNLLKLVKLDKEGAKKYKHFSLGMKQRLGLALTLLSKPSLLLLDEPINGLDPEGIKDFRDILLELHQKTNTTIIISSHILSELSQLATQYIFIDEGRICDVLSDNELKKRCNYILIKTNDINRIIDILDYDDEINEYKIVNDEYIKIYCNKDYKQKVIKILNNNENIEYVKEENITLEEYFLSLINRS